MYFRVFCSEKKIYISLSSPFILLFVTGASGGIAGKGGHGTGTSVGERREEGKKHVYCVCLFVYTRAGTPGLLSCFSRGARRTGTALAQYLSPLFVWCWCCVCFLVVPPQEGGARTAAGWRWCRVSAVCLKHYSSAAAAAGASAAKGYCFVFVCVGFFCQVRILLFAVAVAVASFFLFLWCVCVCACVVTQGSTCRRPAATGAGASPPPTGGRAGRSTAGS